MPSPAQLPRGAKASLLCDAVKSQIGDSLEVVIQMERRPGRRYVSEVVEINGYNPDADLFDCCTIYERRETPND